MLARGSALVAILLTYHLFAYSIQPSFAEHVYHQVRDTPPPIKPVIDSPPPVRKPGITEIVKQTDSNSVAFVDTFPLRISKDSLTSPVAYKAEDSLVIDVPAQKMYLYGKNTNIQYEDNNLSAPKIEFDQKTSILSAYLVRDSAGKVIAYPYYTQADFQSVSDVIKFNLKTKRGITQGTYTKQGEMFVYAEKIKKNDEESFFASKTRFTTCNLDTPHFAFVSKKAKFVNKKWAYTGPVIPEFEGVPVPVVLPFGIFPLSQGRHSGLLAPSFNVNSSYGLSLENLGYYRILGEKWDVITRGSIYSYGGHRLAVNPRYYKRYGYRGEFSGAYQFVKPLDNPGSKTFNISWRHNADVKSRPGVNFQANVDGGSTKYKEQIPNAPQQNFQNSLNSSISYSKTFPNRPYNISVNANHSQNSVSRLINLNLPDVAFNVNTQYPFRRKEPIGEYKWYENLGIAYQGTAKSLTTFYDTAQQIGRQITDNLQYGAQHNLPITLALPPLGVVQVAPTVSYQERWYQRKLVRQYNTPLQKIDTVQNSSGFYTARQMAFALSATTRIFGMFGFRKGRVKAIRHEIRPNIGINYSPNFNAGNYYNSRVDSFGTIQKMSYYENSIYGAFSNQRVGGISFGIDNNISMKVRSRNDTAAGADKKIILIDGLALNGSYNFLADSFKLSQLTLAARSNLFDKINLTAGAVFDPYQTNDLGIRVNKLVWSRKPVSLGNLTSANISLQSSFRGGDKKGLTTPAGPIDPSLLATSGITMEEYQREAAYVQANPGEFADFSIPWSIDFSYSLVFSREFDQTKARFRTNASQGLQFNASANLTPKWKIGANGTFDVATGKLGVLSGYLSRDLHCWQLSINVSPVGRTRFFSINLSPKSPILRDLKVNRTRSFTDL